MGAVGRPSAAVQGVVGASARPHSRQRPQAPIAHAPAVVGLTTPDFNLSFSRYESPQMLIVVA